MALAGAGNGKDIGELTSEHATLELLLKSGDPGGIVQNRIALALLIPADVSPSSHRTLRRMSQQNGVKLRKRPWTSVSENLCHARSRTVGPTWSITFFISYRPASEWMKGVENSKGCIESKRTRIETDLVQDFWERLQIGSRPPRLGSRLKARSMCETTRREYPKRPPRTSRDSRESRIEDGKARVQPEESGGCEAGEFPRVDGPGKSRCKFHTYFPPHYLPPTNLRRKLQGPSVH
ncbi:hypothetical protein FB45DRAFT_1138143 [Roridomyces roridus]|uniref:Uncharacterized protein n=1 Tax=Roridomyces roridus TaxID=1738132 RepID=A0AAD7C1A5_9AGAR|nr:hypothetical protein FB45DRAFT_1138143 [Roridomyces roridus]